MFTKKKEPSELDRVIDDLLLELQRTSTISENYATKMTYLSTLYKLKEQDTPKRVSADTKAIIAANLAGILVIVGYERANIITSKALSFVQKLR